MEFSLSLIARGRDHTACFVARLGSLRSTVEADCILMEEHVLFFLLLRTTLVIQTNAMQRFNCRSIFSVFFLFEDLCFSA